MGRKPKLGPVILRIELISTGREYRPSAGVDDFTGLPIERLQDQSPIRELPDAQELRDAASRERRRLLRDKLASISKPKPIYSQFKRRF